MHIIEGGVDSNCILFLPFAVIPQFSCFFLFISFFFKNSAFMNSGFDLSEVTSYNDIPEKLTASFSEL